MNKFVVFLAALFCMGIFCACEDSAEIPEVETNNTSGVVPDDVTFVFPNKAIRIFNSISVLFGKVIITI